MYSKSPALDYLKVDSEFGGFMVNRNTFLSGIAVVALLLGLNLVRMGSAAPASNAAPTSEKVMAANGLYAVHVWDGAALNPQLLKLTHINYQIRATVPCDTSTAFTSPANTCVLLQLPLR